MNWQKIGAITDNYDVAMLAGHNVMHYSDNLKGDNVHKTFILFFSSPEPKAHKVSL